MTQAEYNQHVTRAAQTLLALHAADKTAAKASCASVLAGCRDYFAGTVAQAVSTLLFSTHPHAADGSSPRSALADVAWAAFAADVKARVDVL